MICSYCGKEIPEDANFCPFCAEPIQREEKTLDEIYLDKKVATARFWSIFGGVLFQIVFLIIGGLFGLIFGMLTIPVCIWAIIYGTRKRTIENIAANKRETIIEKQFLIDKTSICPNCGSHNITIYRKGYDYSKGYWLRKHGGAYVAGMDSNNACCRCMNCGNDWDTGYDYRLIKK